MSLILPFAFFSSVSASNPSIAIGNVIYDIITFDTSTPYPDYNFYFGSTQITSGTLSGIGLLNASDDLDPTFKPEIGYPYSNYGIRTAVLSSGNPGNYKFIIGGFFSTTLSAGGLASNLAIINLSSTGGAFGEYIASAPTGLGYEGTVFDMVMTNRLYVVGNFTNPSSYLRAYELNQLGTPHPTNFIWTLNNIGYCIKSDGLNNIIIGGAFTSVSGTFRRGIVKLASGGTGGGAIFNNFDLTSILTAIGTEVNDIEIMSDKRVIIASRNSGGGGKALIRVPQIVNSSSTTYERFDTIIGLSINQVSKIKIDNNGKLLACVEVVNGSDIEVRLYRFNISGLGPITLDTSFVSGYAFVTIAGNFGDVNKFVYAISVDSQNNIILGGDFTKIDGITRQFYAVLDNNGTLLNR